MYVPCCSRRILCGGCEKHKNEKNRDGKTSGSGWEKFGCFQLVPYHLQKHSNSIRPVAVLGVQVVVPHVRSAVHVADTEHLSPARQTSTAIKTVTQLHTHIWYNPLVRCTSLLGAYSHVRCTVLSRMTHPLLGGYILHWNHVSRYTGNVQFKASKVYMKMAIMAEQLILGMWSTISYLLSPKQHSIRFIRISHIGTKRKLLTEAGSPNILVHVVAMYDAFQAVLGVLCCHVLHLPDVHTRVDEFAAYNGVVRGYTENLVIRCTLIIKRKFSAVTIYRHTHSTSWYTHA